MVKLVEEPHAPSVSDRPTGANRSKACFYVFACMVRLQISNVSVRDCLTIGVQVHLSCP
jgi:hypothetical protein